MAAQEVLCPRDNVAQDDSGTERVQDVLVVRVKDEALSYSACTKRFSTGVGRGAKRLALIQPAAAAPCQRALSGEQFLPWKPMTADSSSSCSIVRFC